MKQGIPSGSESASGTRNANSASRLRQRLSRLFLAPVILWLAALPAEGSWLWQEIGTSGGPGQRAYAVVVWTGTELLVWGGRPFGINTAWKNDGWKYIPGTDSWQPLSSSNAPSARQFPVGVWTGHELMIWGGHKVNNPPDSLQTGACYDPATDTWHPTPTSGAPSKRGDHTMVWTGSEVIVWGGYNFGSSSFLKSGGRYDPATDSWTTVTTLNAPTSRSKHSAVWSGSHMIIWGGGYLNDSIKWKHRSDFGLYDPSTNLWSPAPTTGSPTARSDHSGIWTGNRMIVWGGWDGDRFEKRLLQSGASFDPSAGTWTSLPLTGAPAARASHCAAWSGREMIVWGGSAAGSSQSGARFDPSAETWAAMPTEDAPTGGNRGSAAWTGEAFYLLYDRLARAFETGPYSMDGIPDDWQYFYFGAQNPEGAADQDPDADGQDNRMEFLARTIPTDSQSRLILSISWLPATTELVFSLFPGWPDRTYQLQQSTLLSPIEWQPAGGEWSDLGNGHWSLRLPMPEFPSHFYRVAVGLKR